MTARNRCRHTVGTEQGGFCVWHLQRRGCLYPKKYGFRDINRHIAVRDFLRTHPDIALEYGELKMELAYRFSEDIEGYCTGKDAFVKQLEKDALLWYQNNESYKTR